VSCDLLLLYSQLGRDRSLYSQGRRPRRSQRNVHQGTELNANVPDTDSELASLVACAKIRSAVSHVRAVYLAWRSPNSLCRYMLPVAGNLGSTDGSVVTDLCISSIILICCTGNSAANDPCISCYLVLLCRQLGCDRSLHILLSSHCAGSSVAIDPCISCYLLLLHRLLGCDRSLYLLPSPSIAQVARLRPIPVSSGLRSIPPSCLGCGREAQWEHGRGYRGLPRHPGAPTASSLVRGLPCSAGQPRTWKVAAWRQRCSAAFVFVARGLV